VAKLLVRRKLPSYRATAPSLARTRAVRSGVFSPDAALLSFEASGRW
jgi:hypothetical protein